MELNIFILVTDLPNAIAVINIYYLFIPDILRADHLHHPHAI
jgi:hypothetical protein